MDYSKEFTFVRRSSVLLNQHNTDNRCLFSMTKNLNTTIEAIGVQTARRNISIRLKYLSEQQSLKVYWLLQIKRRKLALNFVFTIVYMMNCKPVNTHIKNISILLNNCPINSFIESSIDLLRVHDCNLFLQKVYIPFNQFIEDHISFIIEFSFYFHL